MKRPWGVEISLVDSEQKGYQCGSRELVGGTDRVIRLRAEDKDNAQRHDLASLLLPSWRRGTFG